jgi:hypothetical protein
MYLNDAETLEGRRELCLEAVSARSPPPRNAEKGIGAVNPWLCLVRFQLSTCDRCRVQDLYLDVSED